MIVTYGFVERIGVKFVLNEPLKLLAKLMHELGARRDLVRVENLRDVFTLRLHLLSELGRVFD